MRFSDESEDPKVRLGMRDGQMKDVINRLAYKLPANDENSLIAAFKPIIKQQAKCFKHYEAHIAELTDNLNDEVSDNSRLEQELAEYFEKKTTEDDLKTPYQSNVMPRKRDFSKLNKKYDAHDHTGTVTHTHTDSEDQTVGDATNMPPSKVQQIKDKIKREDQGANSPVSGASSSTSASSEQPASTPSSSDPGNPFTNNNSDPMGGTSNSATNSSAKSDDSQPSKSSKKSNGNFSQRINRIIHNETKSKK